MRTSQQFCRGKVPGAGAGPTHLSSSDVQQRPWGQQFFVHSVSEFWGVSPPLQFHYHNLGNKDPRFHPSRLHARTRSSFEERHLSTVWSSSGEGLQIQYYSFTHPTQVRDGEKKKIPVSLLK